MSATVAETGRSGSAFIAVLRESVKSSGSPPRTVPGELEFTDHSFNVDEKKMRQIRLHLPLYNGIEGIFIGLEKDAVIHSPVPPGDFS